jgi:plasmid stability protein
LGIEDLAINDYVAIIADWRVTMGSVTIRNLDDAVKRNARLAAARNGRSLEAELRALLERVYADEKSERAARIKAMSDRGFVEHLITITRPGFDEDPFAPEHTSKTADPFDAD